MSFKVKIKSTSGGESIFSVETEDTASIKDLKVAVAIKTDAPASEQRLIYKGQVLKDERTVASYGIKEDHVLHMVRSTRPSSGNTASNTPVSAAATSTSRLPPNHPYSPEMEGIAYRSIMDQMASNPDVMRSLIRSSPQLRELADNNPEINHVLNNPQLLRESINIASNPALMREQMRHTDRAMSNLEAHPEGFNALRRMYEQLQEPLMNAVQGSSPTAESSARQADDSAAQSETSAAETTTTTSASPNTAPLPNPWAPTGGQTQPNRRPPLNDSFAALGLGNRDGTPAQYMGLEPMPGSLGGMGNMGGMDPAALMQSMQDPAVRNMMSSFVSSPAGQQMIRSGMDSNPELRGMMEANPGMREVMTNPDTLRQMFSPEGMAMMRQMQQMMGGANPMAGGGLGTNPPANTTPTGQAGQPDFGNFASMLQSMQGFGAPPPVANPEETYSSQISQLQEMGFYDRESNIRALQSTGGNVQAAVDRLLSQL